MGWKSRSRPDGDRKAIAKVTATAGPSTAQLAKCASCFAQDDNFSGSAQDDNFPGS
jgi:hypothetical protein